MQVSDASRQFFQRLAYVVGLALLAMALQWLARPFIGNGEPFLFFLPAVALASVWFGRAPGALVLVAGLASAGLDELTFQEFWQNNGSRVTISVYLIYGVLLIALGELIRQRTLRATQAQARLRLLAEETDVGLFEVDKQQDTIYLSPPLARLCGVSLPDQAVPTARLVRQLPTALVAQGRLGLESLLSRGGERIEHELAWDTPSGVRWLLLRVRLVRDDQRVTHLRGAVVDITERKHMETQLQDTQLALSRQIDDLHRLQDLSSRLLDTRALQQQLQLVLEAVVDLHQAEHGLLSLLDPDPNHPVLRIEASTGYDAPTLARIQQLMLAGGGTCGMAQQRRERIIVNDFETDARCLDLRPLAQACGLRAAHSTPLISESGELLGIISIQFAQPRAITDREIALTDLCARKGIVHTERARAKADLEESQHRFEAVLDASAAPFCVLTPSHDAAGAIDDFCLTYLNSAAADAIGAPRAALLHQPLNRLMPGCWRTQPEALEHCVAVVTRHHNRAFELTMADHGTFQCIASPVRGSIALWFSDVSDRKRYERELRDADRRKDEFLATLAHELRNPLAPIRQAALLSNSPRATEAQKLWSHAVIERQVQHMALLLDDLLDISRITRGVLSLRLAEVELSAIIEAAIETARPAIDAKGHQLRVSLPTEPVRFEADALRLSQVVANLLTNAAKYTDAHGELTVRAWTRATPRADASEPSSTDQEVMIEVSDNGIGIPPESLDEVFTMFTQLRRGTERVNDGLGIGLALTRGLVALHGGGIDAHSEGAGRGSRFTVRMPLRPVVATDSVQPAIDADGAAPLSILIADDNRDAAESLAVLLELQGHRVSLAFDGQEALTEFERQPADVCLLDIGMPHLNGNEVARRIRALPLNRRPVLVAITGWGQDTDRQDAIAAGFDHHLTKPVDPTQLDALLSHARQPAPALLSI
ncbi:hybrid sensor histidine kinase/response regulator [Roseateles amylovorans]|uniref:histidine kinase n=1 Tax=Roseateles amylovorans TaxID=2978473 RepID=A0ABY6B9F0_9BURK|nr:ATP-binding protein [Roseateles amylovorans]UXH80526.1 ATP-binding protein [Roseateles amylovorans]